MPVIAASRVRLFELGGVCGQVGSRSILGTVIPIGALMLTVGKGVYHNKILYRSVELKKLTEIRKQEG